MNQQSLFMAHMEDIARRALREGAAFSRFLTPADQVQVQQAFSRRGDVSVQFEGGFENAERKLAVFLNPDWGSFMIVDAISALEIKYRRQDTLGHRDILGAVMALGIKREVLGDIETQNPAYAVCTAELAGYLAEELTQAGRVGLEVKQVPLANLPLRDIKYEEIRDTVQSLRLDAIVAAGFSLSRTEAAECIRTGLVTLNYLECGNTAKPVEAQDVIALRGKGKIKLAEVSGMSRKGRMWITIVRYV